MSLEMNVVLYMLAEVRKQLFHASAKCQLKYATEDESSVIFYAWQISTDAEMDQLQGQSGSLTGHYQSDQPISTLAKRWKNQKKSISSSQLMMTSDTNLKNSNYESIQI